MRYHIFILLGVVAASVNSFAVDAKMNKPKIAEQYLDLIVAYDIDAKALWHDADVGGYWGGGIKDPAGDNGAVRGTCGIMLGYAMTAYAMDNGWLNEAQKKQLADAQIDRDYLLKHIKANLAYIEAHHVATAKALEPKWGQSWQSSLWLGAAGPAAILVWNDLDSDQRLKLKVILAAEADRIAAKPPKDYKPGDTGAEENGWDTHALALALAVEPYHAHAMEWWRGLKSYALNTYSKAGDKNTDAAYNGEPIKGLISTANLFDDFSLENHGFFHPDYVQVSGQELGEAQMILELAEKLLPEEKGPTTSSQPTTKLTTQAAATTRWATTTRASLAHDFEPYATHHAKEVWERVAKPLLLPDGEFTFPNGTDWTVRTSQTPSYLAYVATMLHDPVAYVAEQRHTRHADIWRGLSKNGRFFGLQKKMEWFWEPILVKRCSTALLQHALRGEPTLEGKESEALLQPHQQYLPNAQVWTYRNGSYLVTAAWGKKKMGTFAPFVKNYEKNLYFTLPIDGILPQDVDSFKAESVIGNVHIVTLGLKDGRRCAILCLPNSVLWLSPTPLRQIGVQNDLMFGGQRVIYSSDEKQFVPVFSGKSFVIRDYANLDNLVGFISPTGFSYKAATDWNMRATAYDSLAPAGDWGAWQMIPNATSEQTAEMLKHFKASNVNNVAKVSLQDGPQGEQYSITFSFAPVSNKLLPTLKIEQLGKDQH